MNEQTEKTGGDKGIIQGLIRFIEFIVLTGFWIASIVLAVLFIINIPKIFSFEMVALNTIIYGLYPEATVSAAAVLAAIPWVAICLVATVITVGTIVVTILGNDPIGWLDREIERLKLACPLLSPPLPGGGLSAWVACRSRLNVLRMAYWGLFISFGVTAINILVIISRLGAGLPAPPVPPFPF